VIAFSCHLVAIVVTTEKQAEAITRGASRVSDLAAKVSRVVSGACATTVNCGAIIPGMTMATARAWCGGLAIAGSLFAGLAMAQDFQPYPAPQITAEQWASYAELVRQNYGATAEILKGEDVIVFSDMRTRTFWVFTTREHPAHPAWIARQMYEEGGQVNVRQIGYFAGSEPAFAKLFRFYQERNAQLMEDVARRNQ
jgi:hypothetical protein